MRTEIDLLKFYPKSKRPIDERGSKITESDRAIARKFDKEYFDGDRLTGYGGYSYHPRFWSETVAYMVDTYQLTNDSKILDIGCAKGFMMHDLNKLVPDAEIKGVDISNYAKLNAIEDMQENISVCNANNLPFEDNYFDLVISINTLHCLENYDLEKSLKEMERVGKSKKYLCVESYRNEVEKANLLYWQVTCEAINSPKEWFWWFKTTEYSGDYSFIYFE